MAMGDEEVSTCDNNSFSSDSFDDVDYPPGAAAPSDLEAPTGLEAPPGLEADHQDALAHEVARIKSENIALRVKAANARLANANAWLKQQNEEASSMVNHTNAHAAGTATAYNPQAVWCDPQAAWYYNQNSMNWAHQSAWTSPSWMVPAPLEYAA